MMSFEEAQEWGKKRRAEEAARREMLSNIRNEELCQMGVRPTVQGSDKPQYEHPCMPSSGAMAVLFILGYLGCLFFNGWWVGWIMLTVLLGKYLSRHDND